MSATEDSVSVVSDLQGGLNQPTAMSFAWSPNQGKYSRTCTHTCTDNQTDLFQLAPWSNCNVQNESVLREYTPSKRCKKVFVTAKYFSIVNVFEVPFVPVSRSRTLMQSRTSKVSSSCQKVSGSCQRLAVHDEG